MEVLYTVDAVHVQGEENWIEIQGGACLVDFFG
jgi:hypothetical protein